MISEDIRRQIQAGESPAVAFVEDPEAMHQIAPAICGFLNAQGGVVFVGVAPSGEIIGIGADAEGIRRAVEGSLQAAISPKALFTVSVDVENERPILSIEAPRGRDGPYVADGSIYVRRGRETLVIDAHLLRQIAQDRSIEPERWERRPALGLEENDLALDEIERTVADARRTGRFAFDANESEPYEVLRDLGLVTAGQFTQGGDILFARRPTARHPQARVRFVRYITDKAGAEFIDSDWAEGPLVKVFQDVIDRISSHVHVQALFNPSDVERQDKPNYSRSALREGLVNALAHRDYSSSSGGVSVSIYPSRIEIWNSGNLPEGLKLADLKRLHPSIPRNPDISQVLYLRGLMDRVGRGTQKILVACSELGARSPKWEEKNGITLTVYAAGNIKQENLLINARQASLAEALRAGDSISVSEYVARYEGQLSERQARRDLARLEEEGLLQRTGHGRATTYRRTEQGS